MQGFPGGTVVKNPPANVGDTRDMGSIPGSGRSPGVGNGNPFQCSCLKNPRDEGAWWAAAYGVAQSQTRLKQLSSSSSKTLITIHKISCMNDIKEKQHTSLKALFLNFLK